jgi:replicative DNA helicase
MSSLSLVLRMLCSRSRVNLRNMNEGFLADRDFPKLSRAASQIAASKLFLHAISDLSIGQLRAEARRMHRQYGIKFLIVDYLQLLSSPGTENRQQEVASISSGCKSVAMELKIPVLALSQLNDDGKLRESRAIGQDADNVWMLNRGDKDEEEGDGGDAHPVNLKIIKQRNGPRNVTVPLTFLSGITRFESAAKITDDDLPYKD